MNPPNSQAGFQAHILLDCNDQLSPACKMLVFTCLRNASCSNHEPDWNLPVLFPCDQMLGIGTLERGIEQVFSFNSPYSCSLIIEGKALPLLVFY